MTLMKAIPTKYHGVEFRSRLEARYALMFDMLDIKWEYEPEGFDLPKKEWYLPDFYLPEVYLRSSKKVGVYFEVKPSKDKAEEKRNIFEQFDQPLVVAMGTPTLNVWGDEWLNEWWKERWDNFMFFKYCKKCKLYEIEFAESNYCVCRNCGGVADEVDNWEEIVSVMKSKKF